MACSISQLYSNLYYSIPVHSHWYLCLIPLCPGRRMLFVSNNTMASIPLADMDPPVTHHNGLLPDLDPTACADPKQESLAPCLTVHLYYQGKDRGIGGASVSDHVLSFPPGEYVSEEVCISAARACGESQEAFRSDVCLHAFHHILGRFCNISKFCFCWVADSDSTVTQNEWAHCFCTVTFLYRHSKLNTHV